MLASTGARAYIGAWSRVPSGGSGAEPPIGVRGRNLPEAESSVAFEAPAEEPNLHEVVDVHVHFCSEVPYYRTVLRQDVFS